MAKGVALSLTGRAQAAYYGSAPGYAGIADAADVRETRGLRYVVVWAGAVALAVYRVKKDGVLRRLRRPPVEVTIWQKV